MVQVTAIGRQDDGIIVPLARQIVPLARQIARITRREQDQHEVTFPEHARSNATPPSSTFRYGLNTAGGMWAQWCKQASF